MFPFNPYTLYGIEGAKTHKDTLTWQSRDGMADVIRGYRQLAKATINENRVLDALGPSEARKCVQRGSASPARLQNIIHQNNNGT